MNGQFLRPEQSAGSFLHELTRWSTNPDAVARRLHASLALSCVLHAAVALSPFLGQSATEARLAFKGRQNPPHFINATLAMEGEVKISDVTMPAAAQSLPDLSAPDRPAAEAQPVARPRAEGLGLLPLAAPSYYTTDQLTKRPQPLAAAELDVAEIRPIVASGKIILKLWINEFGAVSDVEVEKTQLPEMFSRTAIAAFKGLQFAPGELNGRPVRTVMRIEVTYDDGRLPLQ